MRFDENRENAVRTRRYGVDEVLRHHFVRIADEQLIKRLLCSNGTIHGSLASVPQTKLVEWTNLRS